MTTTLSTMVSLTDIPVLYPHDLADTHYGLTAMDVQDLLDTSVEKSYLTQDAAEAYAASYGGQVRHIGHYWCVMGQDQADILDATAVDGQGDKYVPPPATTCNGKWCRTEA